MRRWPAAWGSVVVGWGLTAAALLLTALAYTWLITDGTWSFFGYEFIGDTFDELALRLSAGRCDVTPGMPAHEGIRSKAGATASLASATASAPLPISRVKQR